MPQARAIKHIVDALRSQDRIIVQLECGHNISITRMQLEADLVPGMTQQELAHADSMLCPFCPDVATRRVGEDPLHQVWTEPRLTRIDLPSPNPEDFSD